MRQFTAQDARAVASFINACEWRAQESPPDEVVFGDPCETSEDSFVDCDDELTELFTYFDSSLEVDGFVAFTP
jgi:hypothetical protein